MSKNSKRTMSLGCFMFLSPKFKFKGNNIDKTQEYFIYVNLINVYYLHLISLFIYIYNKFYKNKNTYF